jgi:hypothetical protein
MDPAQHRGFALLANHTWPRRRQDRDLINTVRSAMAEMLFS